MFTRRQILERASAGFGYLAFAGMSSAKAAGEPDKTNPLAPKAPHFPAQAKRVIFLCMQGGPSHVDTYDYKPQLTKDHGKRGKYGGSLLKSPWKFSQRGKSGLWISDLFPNVADHADDLTLIRSMQCDQPVHPGAMTQMHTGTAQFIRPSLGAWTLYGLGTENDSLPGFISLSAPSGSSRNYGSSFLPAIYGGSKVGRGGRASRSPRGGSSESVPDIKNPALSDKQQRTQLDLIQALNREKIRRDKYQPGVEGVIESYELAFRMQDAMPALMDTSKETQATLRMYGADGGATENFGKQCLLARRFVEAGVRFVEVTHGNWDQHANLSVDHQARAEACDKPIAGLLQDLKQKDMLKETLIIWGGEFGRTPAAQGGDGRNHNNKGYTTWMAGGGVKGGFSYGATDEHGFEAVENKCHIHDWHATILHLLGLDHEQLTYRYAGRDFRLTDVHGNVAKDIIA
ncbi:MAG: sulfatase [Planctomycetaceae bacterium]|nr:sulfatase [Planctomycetaceae bacterium]